MHGPTCIVWANLTAFSLQDWVIGTDITFGYLTLKILRLL